MRVQPGAVIGADGFGYEFSKGRHEKVPQVGIVSIGDDVVIRVRAERASCRVDIRSASRLGRGDLGVNAARIRRFLRACERELQPSPGVL